MLLFVAIGLFVMWLLGFSVFHVTTAFIHVVLLLALVAVVVHFVRYSTTRAPSV